MTMGNLWSLSGVKGKNFRISTEYLNIASEFYIRNIETFWNMADPMLVTGPVEKRR